MPRGFSIWMDALRVLATLVVLASHLAYPRFTSGLDWVRTYNLGSDAVIVFFVISGFVIAFAAERDNNLGTYTFNRLTRLWSVLLPALVLTLVFDEIGRNIDPSAYPATFFNDVGWGKTLLRGLSFSNQWTGTQLRLGTNGPLWSLSYEAGYYALFAAAFFLKGARRAVVLLALIVLIGPRVLLLMPAWLMGVGLYYIMKRGLLNAFSHSAALVLAIGAPALYLFGLVSGWPAFLAGDASLAFSANWAWNAVIGILTFLHLLGVARVLSGAKDQGHASDMWVRWAAGASFSVYVTHYPALHLLDAALGEFSGRGAALGLGALLVGLVFAAIFERPLKRIRGLFQIDRKRVAPAS